MQKQLEAPRRKELAEENLKNVQEAKSIAEADKISMELELNKFREEHDVLVTE